MANTTWNNADKSGNITLSGTNSLTATSGTGSSGIRTIDRQGAGKYYFEYVCTTWSTAGSVGVVNAAASLGTVNATPTNACLVYAGSGNIWINNILTSSTLGARANGDTIAIALDQDNKRIWFRVAPSGNWNGSGTANPATGVGGLSIASISLDGVLSPLYGVFAPVGSGYVVTANFGDTAFTGTTPVGFTSGFPTGTPTLVAANTQMLVEEWGAPNPAAQLTQLLLEEWTVVVPPPFTSWNPADKESHITLSGSNLWATGTAGQTGVVRTIDKKATGKFYWECLITGTPTILTGVGLYTGIPPVGTYISSSSTGTCGVIQSIGTVYVDGSTSLTVGGVFPTSIQFGNLTSGTLVGIAVDLTAHLIWFRLGAAGNWNNNATRDPVAGTGGVAIPNIGQAFAAFPVACFGGADQIVANFGDTAFTGTVPSGFTAGFPAGAVIPPNEVVTQVGLEQWASMIPPRMQATQAAIEQWTSTANVTTRMLLTQEAIEQWSTVAEASAITARQAALTVVT